MPKQLPLTDRKVIVPRLQQRARHLGEHLQAVAAGLVHGNPSCKFISLPLTLPHLTFLCSRTQTQYFWMASVTCCSSGLCHPGLSSLCVVSLLFSGRLSKWVGVGRPRIQEILTSTHPISASSPTNGFLRDMAAKATHPHSMGKRWQLPC